MVALFTSLVTLGLGVMPARLAHATVACNELALVTDITNAPDGGDLLLEAGCTYRLTNEHPTGSRSGLTVKKSLTIHGNGATITRDTAAAFRIFDVDSTGRLILIDITISNGSAAVPNDLGGGIRNTGGRVTLIHSNVLGNRADRRGGGIGNYGTLEVINSTISGNSAGTAGGGIGNGEPATCPANCGANCPSGCPEPPPPSGTVVLMNSIVSGNSALLGGGIASGSTSKLTLTDCIITNNLVYGIASQGTAFLKNCSMIRNAASAIDNGGTMFLEDTAIIDNVAVDGGAIINTESGSVTLTNSAIISNRAGRGGGIANEDGSTATLTNSAIVGNTADSNFGGGIFNESGSTVILSNSPVVNNTPNNCNPPVNPYCPP